MKTLAEQVAAVEAAFARGKPPARDVMTRAAAGAVAARFLAVGTPRTIGLALGGDDATRALDAMRVFFAPREIRTVTPLDGARVASLAEVCACDIVIADQVAIEARWIRRGTHLDLRNGAVPAGLAARVVDEAGLVEIAAGRIDGRELDEITIYTGGP